MKQQAHTFLAYFKRYSETHLSGRWITYEMIKPLIEKSTFEVHQVGTSEENLPIHTIRVGNGPKKILIWSQMHGNESTGTKAVFDFLQAISNADFPLRDRILEQCTLTILPMLNPDGAQYYTRVNAKGVDLNRDAVTRIAKESRVLRKVLEEVAPDFCFNLHDQRTIFGVSGTTNPATLSFLAPSEEETRAVTQGRKETMNVIVAMNELLQDLIPNHVGRYTDTFYPKATGDNFQKLGYNTILVESGHYPEDYEREETRKYTFIALLQGIYHIATTSDFSAYTAYFSIPDNEESFLDLLHRYPNTVKAYQFQEQINNGVFELIPQEVDLETTETKFFHKEIVFVS